jgi:hypothetical protein
MSNETSYNKLTLAIATAMIVMTVSVGYQLAQPAVAQNLTEEVGQIAENATGNQTGNQSGGPLEQLGQMLGFGGGN